MTNIELMNFWIESSDKDFDTMLHNYKGKKYDWALFIGYLVLEKLFKALYAKVHADAPQAPKIHNLLRLAELSNIELDEEMTQKLSLINRFNIDGRYADAKFEFYKLCTKEFTDEQLKIIKGIREWLKAKSI